MSHASYSSVPPTRVVAAFPPILAGTGRHRLPPPLRRPGPVATGLLVAATTLALGALRPVNSGASAAPPGSSEVRALDGAHSAPAPGASPLLADVPRGRTRPNG
ncbi:hypothetical protein [Streptacidiphilus monticola]|jgi:hypothetical protein|uniref:Uncharacterized protein n=1 Tax=Streptacidiphilus monticola TaxID=2161674 RepID=A0ABW1FZH0_9ACTN